MERFTQLSNVYNDNVALRTDFCPDIYYMRNLILAQHSDLVSVDKTPRRILKVGRNQSVGNNDSGYTLWYTGQDEDHETYVADNTNSIDSISSSDASDTEQVTIRGFTEADNEKTTVVQTATLNGRTRVALTTPLNRVERMTHSEDSDVSLVGEIYIYENTALTAGKPNDTTKIHLTTPAGKHKSRKAAGSVPKNQYYIITQFRGTVLERANSLAEVAFETKKAGGVWKTKEEIACSDASNGIYNFKPFLLIPKNADYRLVARSDGPSRDISGSLQGYIATIVDS